MQQETLQETSQETIEYSIDTPDSFYNTIPSTAINKTLDYQLTSLSLQLSQLSQNSHPEYLKLLQLITNERNNSIQQSKLFLQHQINTAGKIYEHEYYSSVQNLESQKNGLREKMLLPLEEKKRKLLEDLQTFDYKSCILKQSLSQTTETKAIAARKTRANANRVLEEQKAKRGGNTRGVKSSSGPSLVGLLKDHEMYDDISFFRRSGIQSKRHLKK